MKGQTLWYLASAELKMIRNGISFPPEIHAWLVQMTGLEGLSAKLSHNL